MLSFKAIETGYKKSLHQPFTYDLEKGERLMIIGANGSGKSTFLKTINGIIPKLSGQILWEDVSITSLSMMERAQKVSTVNTQRPSIPFMRGFDLVLMGRFPHNQFSYAQRSDIDLVHKTFSDLEMSHLSDKLIQECSDGELQLLCIAQAIVQAAPIMLLDEITSHLDVKNTSRVMQVLCQWVADHSSCMIMATHDLHVVKKYATKFLLFKNDNIQVIENNQEIGLPELEMLLQDEKVL